MDIFIQAFKIFLYQPLLNALVFLYQYLPGHDFGLAIIALTILIRLILYPFMAKSIKSQKTLSDLQPKLQEIQQKYKDNKEQQTKEVMALYKEKKINPFGGCLFLLIQLPVLIALYRVFWRGLQPGMLVYLYSFIPRPEVMNPVFIGLINLNQPNFILAVLAGIAQFFQTKMTMPKKLNTNPSNKTSQFSEMFQKQALYLFPLFTVFILWKLPAALGLYWLVSSIFSISQQYFVLKPKKNL